VTITIDQITSLPVIEIDPHRGRIQMVGPAMKIGRTNQGSKRIDLNASAQRFLGAMPSGYAYISTDRDIIAIRKCSQDYPNARKINVSGYISIAELDDYWVMEKGETYHVLLDAVNEWLVGQIPEDMKRVAS
jgi:hypothetical protein